MVELHSLLISTDGSSAISEQFQCSLNSFHFFSLEWIIDDDTLLAKVKQVAHMRTSKEITNRRNPKCNSKEEKKSWKKYTYKYIYKWILWCCVLFFFFGRKCLNVGTFLSISLFFLLSLLFIIFHPSHRKMRNNTKQVKRNQMIRREGSVFNWLSSFSTGHLGGNFGVPLHKLSLISATALPLPVENDQLKQMTLLHFNWNFLRHWHCSVTASGTWKLKLAPTKLNKSIQTEITPRKGTAL